jgi:pimeloyl-ACP methyl ester carboxylesterase
VSELIQVGGTRDTNRRGDVVFVHGLNGDAYATWQPDGQPERFWPNWLCEDLPGVGVWSVGYSVNSFGWSGSTMPLTDRATNTLVLLKTEGIGIKKPVIFITHSLGGLLVKEMLRRATDGSVSEAKILAEYVCGVVFLSTPHSGSNLANFVNYLKFLLPTISVRELTTQEPRLRELNTWYRNNAQQLGIETQVYCERRSTPSGKGWFSKFIRTIVVDAASADPGISGVTAVPIDDDHISISRPERESLLYKRIRQFVAECIKDEPISEKDTTRKVESILSQGFQLGSYVIDTKVGQGGVGSAYRAWDDKHGRHVCVKIFHPVELSKGKALASIFRKNVRGLLAMNHPGVVKVFDWGEYRIGEQASYYVAMDFVYGILLDQWNEQLDSSSWNAMLKRANIALKISEALQYAHEFSSVDEWGFERIGLMHGDIKPRNILVKRDDSPVLIDFGMIDVNKLIDYRPVLPSDCTQAFGTPGYMSPEQSEEGIATRKSDVFSFGVTLFQLFLPSTSFSGSTKLALDQWKWKSDLPEIVDLLIVMVEPNPLQRPGMSAVTELLRKLCKRLSNV